MSNNIGKLFGTVNFLFFSEFKKSLTRRKTKDVFKMSLRSESHVGNLVVSVSELPDEAQNVQKRKMKSRDTKRS